MATNISAADNTQITYTISFSEAQAHYADVEMKVSGLKQDILELKMPVWTPGSYLIREFEKNIESLSASTGGKVLAAKKNRKNIWQLNTAGITSVNVKYRVYAFEASVRTSFIDASHAFLSSPDIFIYPGNMLHASSTIHIKPYKGWASVSTSLEKVNGDPFTRYSPDFDILFDSPIEVGNQDVFGFDVGGVKYEMAMVGDGKYDKDRLTKDLPKIIEQEVAIFGENPNKHYTFIVHNAFKGGGGLEHLSSTTLGASREAYATEVGYQNFLSLAAHEHFHLWNVKRLRPIALGPFDYDNENYTTNLWIAEGFTAYYQDIIVRRTQLYSPENYLAILAEDINQLENTAGARVQTLAEASYDAWIKAYRPNENSGNTSISYYTKGSIIALLLDLEIINDSKGTSSLDDVMRYMYNEYYKTQKRGYTDTEFKQALEKFAGKNLDEFYARYINGLTPVAYNSYLAYAGYKLVNALADDNEAALGITQIPLIPRVIVATVQRGSAAWIDGINVNDEIITIDGEPVPEKGNLITGKKPGNKIEVGLIRDGLPMLLKVTLLKNTRVKYSFEELPNLTPQQFTVRRKWLTLK
ncbi:M61 family metallopeptidase [Mucilaginibacter sp. UR6-11]|uniref:M61 family metallopeptidase n=1 Tax=Mucilaginibacter sp. UR6-11 TaxID=1435644 RepID=UPI001E49F7C2|nr:PDZ domain-containing protein [Mucilaginibacter sp. UR6-11]MCC8426574.1 PDZ domain-containing protein [Mucilaginibacter sp. UR6-11]